MSKNDEMNEDIKPDLKHDTMEFAASADGETEEDIEFEEDELTPEELDVIEGTDAGEMAQGLNSAELDRAADDRVYFEGEAGEDSVSNGERKEHRRK